MKAVEGRRTFLKLAAGAAGAGLARCSPFLQWQGQGTPGRTILATSDAHIGYAEDGRDGSQWLEEGLRDARGATDGIDFCLFLGDAAHGGTEEQFRRYASIRGSSGIDEWYEIAGNHDLTDGGIDAYRAIVGKRMTYAVVDGNVVWVMLSDEQESVQGELGPATVSWLTDLVSRHRRDKNIIVSSHQLVYGTVGNPIGTDDRYLYENNHIATGLSALPVDLWLCGHEHHVPWSDATNLYTGQRTTFINVSSVSHAYGTGESHSLLLSLVNGSAQIVVRRRVHDTRSFDQPIAVGLSFPLNLPETPQRSIEEP